MNYNSRNQNKSKNIRFTRNYESLKTSLSFNNFNINRYSNPNITYSIENNINDLLIKRMSEFSFGTSFQNKKAKFNKERKINYINVNNYFNPQINIIKVNKLNEAKRIINKGNKRNKMKLVNKNNLKLNKNNNKNDKWIYLEKLKMIQLWWKQINKIIKIQKNYRGYLFRTKLLKHLEKEEKIMYNIFILYKIIKKTINNYAFNKIINYSLNIKSKSKSNNYLRKNQINAHNKKLLKPTKENVSKSINNIEKLNIKNFVIGNNSIKKNINKNNKNIDKYINIKKNCNKNFKSLENISYNNINNSNQKRKINEELGDKITHLIKNKYLFPRNKQVLINKITNLTNTYGYNINTLNSQRSKNNLKNRKNVAKSRNIEQNNTYFLQNSKKNNNSKILTENTQYLYYTNKNFIKVNNNTTRNSVITKTLSSNMNTNNNLIMNNPMSDRNWPIKRKDILINQTLRNNKTKSNLIKKDKKKIKYMKSIKYYFSLWKQKKDKQMILKYLIKYLLYHNGYKNIIIINNIYILRESLLQKGLGLLIKKIFNKCTLYKYFILFNYYTDKINIFKKLKNYLKYESKYKNHIKMSKFLENRIKDDNQYSSIVASKSIKIKKIKNIYKNKINELTLSSSYIYPNKIKLVSKISGKKYKNLDLNNSNQKLQRSKVKINRFIYNNLFKKEPNNNNSKNCLTNLATFDSNLIMQTNQLKMIFNLLELKTKRKKSIFYYFNKWKINTNTNFDDDSNKRKNTLSLFKNTKEKYFSVDMYNKMSSRNLSSRERKRDFFQKQRNNSYKDKYNKVYSKINFKSKSDYNFDIKSTLNNTTNILSNDSMNKSKNSIIYKKKFVGIGSKTSRYNIREYSSILEFKRGINKNVRDDSYINIINPINTINGSSYGEKFYKKIEEREIFFNKKTNENKSHNISSYQVKNKKDNFAINYYYKNIPKRNCSYGQIHSQWNINDICKKFIKSKNNSNTKSKSFKNILKRYYYNFFLRKLKPRKKTF